MINPVLPVYSPFATTLVRGEGVYLFDEKSKKYVDFACGYGVTALGHCHPHLIKALTDQANKVWHISNMFHHPERERLAERLVEKTFADTVFFTNSGVEAWELGLKMVRRHFSSKGQPGKNRMIVIEGAFHGRTMAAISAAPRPYMIDGFGPLLDGFDVVPFNNMNELRAKIIDQTAAIHLEPVMGEGGVKPHSKEYVQSVRQACDEFDLLLFFDEIQSGIGRTGKYFAHEWFDVKPDIVCAAKGIGGGFPLGCLFANEKAAGAMVPGSHGTTYGGNPLAMAVGNAVLDIMSDDEFMPHVNRMGMVLRAELDGLLEKYPHLFSETRGIGLMQGIVCKPNINNRHLIETIQAEGVISIPSGENTVRFFPPLIIQEREIFDGFKIIDQVCATYKPA